LKLPIPACARAKKLYEELFHANEKLVEAAHPSIRLADARNVASRGDITNHIRISFSAARRHDTQAIKKQALRVASTGVYTGYQFIRKISRKDTKWHVHYSQFQIKQD